MGILSSVEIADVIVLEADGKIDDKNGYGYPIAKRLEEFGFRPVIVSLEKDTHLLEKLPPKPMIISGGMTAVTSDVQWVVKAKEFVKKIITYNQSVGEDKRIPLMGICFGSQLIAESFEEGSVKYLEDPDMGITKVKLNREHKLFNGFNNPFFAYTFHYNQIQNNNLNIISLNNSKSSIFVEAFEVPNASCYGVQFHPEFTHDEFVSVLITYKNLINDLGLDADDIINNLKRLPSNAGILKSFVLMTKKKQHSDIG
ncbi:type 1 glutamine amidotransferase [Thermohalobacter berrensis]|uniref:Glutamine amidotransferase domain-containing protein n=1 Tax=Thermohalobacter berrensis TaxID=99594 RepID=A0A419T7D8_9FIRM|nr:gamma-glutamyl-gamma-aminobutyrate hydrolase family protein [Thermohalobacter berrensis]RKD33474.1 hypothetical protein BET03_09490 [Thermohalobacter berrensis]